VHHCFLQTLAEKLAWELSSEYKFDLVSINPSFMLGPAVSAYGTSNSIMEMKVTPPPRPPISTLPYPDRLP
jgi:hypothetical protein